MMASRWSQLRAHERYTDVYWAATSNNTLLMAILALSYMTQIVYCRLDRPWSLYDVCLLAYRSRFRDTFHEVVWLGDLHKVVVG